MESLERFIEYKKNPTVEERNALVEDHLYMVDILIRKYLNKGVDYDDAEIGRHPYQEISWQGCGL